MAWNRAGLHPAAGCLLLDPELRGVPVRVFNHWHPHIIIHTYTYPNQSKSIFFPYMYSFKPSVWFPAAELGDPANHLTLNSTGGPEDPFSKTALMISTGDAETVIPVHWVLQFCSDFSMGFGSGRTDACQMLSSWECHHDQNHTLFDRIGNLKKKQERHVRRAFVGAGLPASVTNLDVVPADVARFR